MLPRHLPFVVIGLDRPKTFGQLMRELTIPSSTLSRCLKILLKNEMVMVKPEEETREGKRTMWTYELTPKGKRKYGPAKAAITYEKRFWERLGRD